MIYRLQVFILSLLFGLLLAGSGAAREEHLIAFGDPFPEIDLPTPADADARVYLGVPEAETFRPSQVKTQLLLVELLNTHCLHCQQQTLAYNDLYDLIEGNSETRGKIKLLGIAAGNLEEEVQTFRERIRMKFPLLADPGFQAYRVIGGSITPFSIYVRQDQSGRPGVVAGTHLGMNTRYQALFEELRRLATEEPEELRRQGKDAERIRKAVAPLLSETELQLRVRNAFIGTGGILAEFVLVELRSGRRVYTAMMRRGETLERLFAEVVSRKAVCDLCHDVHFVYVFDSTGRIVGFEPLKLTKHGNVEWSQADIQRLRQRVVGKYLTVFPPFDPGVDAITSATISSAIIFDGIAQGESLLQELRDKGLR